jgi:hypothetical protein
LPTRGQCRQPHRGLCAQARRIALHSPPLGLLSRAGVGGGTDTVAAAALGTALAESALEFEREEHTAGPFLSTLQRTSATSTTGPTGPALVMASCLGDGIPKRFSFLFCPSWVF